jgi:hypothetical protein
VPACADRNMDRGDLAVEERSGCHGRSQFAQPSQGPVLTAGSITFQRRFGPRGG